jgi:hypothetical protein
MAAGGPAPAAPVVTASVGPAESCYEHPDIFCCGESPVHAVELTGVEEGLLYTLTRSDGTLVAADAPAPVRGFVLCGAFTGASGTPEVAATPWAIHDDGPITLNVVARDARGQTSPPAVVTIDGACAPAPETIPDGGPDGGDAPPPPPEPDGCAVGGRGQPSLGLLLLAVLIALSSRRR